MVMSVGWNPYYKNEKKSMETHIMHKFDQDFYGSMLKVVVLGYLRNEKNFGSLGILNYDHLENSKLCEGSFKTTYFLIDVKQWHPS
ncbi:hypothetical protein HPB48_013725 [Haemaphysalis longicornis]|uniref:riboflavin kinase n=1 Tax=Haemaphysalis longicornis TaxID=44386 RepID=A0A9J6FZC0_HAELO|nr:hypothetical protein HPB48_013725 [Haemaphysalis longicornis]